MLPQQLKQPIYEEQQEQLLSPDFATLEKRVFLASGGKVYIGGVEVTSDIRGILRDEATYIAKSRLWEIFNAAIINESAQQALNLSENWEGVLAAKQLHHWAYQFRNTLYALMKP